MSDVNYDVKAGRELLRRAAAGESVEIGPRQAAALLAEWERHSDALTEIALAGMTLPPMCSEEEVASFHASQAWNFIGIAARARK
jgi:hypothetical protein